MSDPIPEPVKLTYVFHADDDDGAREISKYLEIIKRNRVIEELERLCITAGTDVEALKSATLDNAEIVLLVVSASFLASEACACQELGRVLARHKAKQCVVIPVLWRTCFWEEAEFSKFAPLPPNGIAIRSSPDFDVALTDVAKGVKLAAIKIQANRPPMVAEDAATAAGDRGDDKRIVTITMDGHVSEFGEDDELLFNEAIRRILRRTKPIEITKKAEGSVKISIRLTAKQAEQLHQMRNEPEFRLAMYPFVVRSVELRTRKRVVERVIGTQTLSMDGRWKLEDMQEFCGKYQRLYAMVYYLKGDADDESDLPTQNAIQPMPMRDGFSSMHLYNGVTRALPERHKPQIRSIQYASPGEMKLTLVADVAEAISNAIDAIKIPKRGAGELYTRIHDQLSSKKANLLSVDATRDLTRPLSDAELNDPELEQRYRVLTEEELQMAMNLARQLDSKLGLHVVDRLLEITGNRLSALKIMMTAYRRLEDLNSFSVRDLLEY